MWKHKPLARVLCVIRSVKEYPFEGVFLQWKGFWIVAVDGLMTYKPYLNTFTTSGLLVISMIAQNVIEMKKKMRNDPNTKS